jgi:hypothetical protein
MENRDGISTEIEELGRRLEEWRGNHVRPTRLPEELWEAAVVIAMREGIYRTSRALHLDYANLKRRVQTVSKLGTEPARTALSGSTRRRRRTGVSSAKRKRATTGEPREKGADFVELLAGSIGVAGSPPDCVVEVEGGAGRMRIQMKLTAAEMMSLVRDWRGGQR